jgi:hypothetical protein
MAAAGVQPAVDRMCDYLEVVGYKPPELKSQVFRNVVMFLDDAKDGLGWAWEGLKGEHSRWGRACAMGHVAVVAMLTVAAMGVHDREVWGQCRLQRLARRDPADIDGTPEDESEVLRWPVHKQQLLEAIESAAQVCMYVFVCVCMCI